MPWTLIDSALYQLLRGQDPGATERKLIERQGASVPEAGRAVKSALQAIACGAMCAGRPDEPIDLSGVPYNPAIPHNTYRFLVGIGIGGREDREVTVDVVYESPGTGTATFAGKRGTGSVTGPISEVPTPQEIYALAWQAVAEQYPEKRGMARQFTFRAIARGLFRVRREML